MNPELKKLAAEYDQLCTTAFWQKYQTKLRTIRQEVSSKLEKAPLDDVQRYQGQIEMADIILRLPTRVIESGKES